MTYVAALGAQSAPFIPKPSTEMEANTAALPIIDVPLDDGEIVIFTAVPAAAHLLLLGAVTAALICGLASGLIEKDRRFQVLRSLPQGLLAIAALWVAAHGALRVPVPNYDGFEPLGEPLLLAAGAVLYGLGDLLVSCDRHRRMSVGLALGSAGLTVIAVCGWRTRLPEAQPISAILLVLLLAVAAAATMIWLWRRLGGVVFGWLFLACLFGSMVLIPATAHGFIWLPGAMLACGLMSLSARALSIADPTGSSRMTGWGPSIATVLFQVLIASVALGAPTF